MATGQNQWNPLLFPLKLGPQIYGKSMNIINISSRNSRFFQQVAVVQFGARRWCGLGRDLCKNTQENMGNDSPPFQKKKQGWNIETLMILI